jgi:hypothetical protein
MIIDCVLAGVNALRLSFEAKQMQVLPLMLCCLLALQLNEEGKVFAALSKTCLREVCELMAREVSKRLAQKELMQ